MFLEGFLERLECILCLFCRSRVLYPKTLLCLLPVLQKLLLSLVIKGANDLNLQRWFCSHKQESLCFFITSVGACVAKVKERSSSWTWSYHVVVVVSFLLEVAIGCQWSKSLLCKLQFFHSGFAFYLEDRQIKSSPGFLPVWFSWVIISLCSLFSTLYNDMIYLC